jgi:hypothetical protein
MIPSTKIGSIHKKTVDPQKKLWISTEKIAPSTGARMSLSY